MIQSFVQSEFYQQAIGTKSFLCPECSYERSGGNRNKKCLRVTFEDDGAVWFCHNCEAKGQMKMQEEQRLQSADVMGQQFMFGAQAQREVAKLNRTAGMLDNAQQDLRDMRAAEAKAEANMFSSIGNVVGGIGSLIGG